MTTTISFVTRDCVVIGCDSLSTVSRPMLDPFSLLNNYLEIDSDGSITIKKDGDGKDLLGNISDLTNLIETIPYNQQTNVTKIYQLSSAKAGLLFAGIAAIGDLSIKNIVDEFLSDEEIDKYLSKSTYTIQGIATRLEKFIKKLYDKEYGDVEFKPNMEIIVSGYSKGHNKPEVYKIIFQQDGSTDINQSCKRGEYDIVFGGQHDIIERIVYGIDYTTYNRYRDLIVRVNDEYYKTIQTKLEKNDVAISILHPSEVDSVNKILKERFWSGVGFALANFSEQAAIDFVEFLVDVMIKSQQFSSRLPTVGGDIHMAIITKSGGFRWLSKEEYSFQGNKVKKYEN